jgi:type IV secretion system protein VirB10
LVRQAPAQDADSQQKLKRRDEVPAASAESRGQSGSADKLWVVPAGTKIPIQLRQAISTKNAQPGDPIYGQTTFPLIVDNRVMIPAGTFVKGVVDMSRRAGRIKGKAELQFHLTRSLTA